MIRLTLGTASDPHHLPPPRATPHSFVVQIVQHRPQSAVPFSPTKPLLTSGPSDLGGRRAGGQASRPRAGIKPSPLAHQALCLSGSQQAVQWGEFNTGASYRDDRISTSCRNSSTRRAGHQREEGPPAELWPPGGGPVGNGTPEGHDQRGSSQCWTHCSKQRDERRRIQLLPPSTLSLGPPNWSWQVIFQGSAHIPIHLQNGARPLPGERV